MSERPLSHWKNWTPLGLAFGLLIVTLLAGDHPYFQGIVTGISIGYAAYSATVIRNHYRKPPPPKDRLKKALLGTSSMEAVSTLVEELIGSLLSQVPSPYESEDLKVGVLSFNWVVPRQEPFDAPMIVTVEARPLPEPKASELN